MTNKFLSIDKYFFRREDELFLDANIWLYIFGPQTAPNHPRTRTYSGALKRILMAQSSMLIDVLVLSEFINRYARIEYGYLSPASKPEFKVFRQSPQFDPVAKDISIAVKTILNHARCIGNNFENLAPASWLAAFENQRHDFNDLVIAELCKARGLKLVTHDADFKFPGLTIITANPHLLRP